MKTLPPPIQTLIEAAGGVPRQYDGEMQWRRYHHQDLLDLHDDELEGERVMVGVAWSALIRDRFLGCDEELRWFTERRAMVLAEATRRARRP